LPLLFILRQLAWSNLTLKDIGLYFGLGESGVSQAGRRVAQKVENDKQLKKGSLKFRKR